MAITANSGPEIIYGITVSASGATTSYNEQRGPSLIDLGDGMLDPRAQFGYGYQPGQGPTNNIFGFWGQQAVVDYVPSTISTNALAATSSGNGGGAALTLTATGAGITTVSCIVAPETGKLAGTLFCIDGPCGGSSAAGVSFGQANAIQVWNPATLGGRCITILATGADGGTWTIAGRDAYGFKMTEQITAANTLMTSLKAYKYISAISASTTLASTGIIVGTADTFGFPLLVQSAPYVSIWVGASSLASLVTVVAGNHTYGSSLATATSTNGDVRGTYKSSIASNSTGAAPVRIVMLANPTVGPGVTSPSSVGGLNNVTANSFYGLFGATQFSSV
jgi:hypothetical protein